MKESKLKKAIEIATMYHKWQKRKDGSDYINHPLAVMETLKKYSFPEDALIAAVLHDVCEDSNCSNLNINSIFWTRVWFIINALTKNKKPKNNKELKAEYEKRQKAERVSNLENYKNYDEYIDYRFHLYLNRLYTWIIAEPWIFFIKVADQMHNLSSMDFFPKEKKERKIKEVEKYFLPIYEKSKILFNVENNTLKKYDIFLELLVEKIEKAKWNI